MLAAYTIFLREKKISAIKKSLNLKFWIYTTITQVSESF